VLCVHGNEVDAWNVADYEKIRRIGRDLVQGRGAETWVPNGGSQLVSEVMNRLKQDYPFIDLLKPEVPSVFPTLIALRPSVAFQLGKLAAAGARRSWDAVRMATGFLGEAPPQAEPAPPLASGGNRVRALQQQREEMARDLLDRAEASWQDKVMPLDLVSGDQREDYVGGFRALKQLVTGKGPIEALREALDGLVTDRSFDPGAEDDTYRELDKLVAGDIDFLIAGHTHLERALRRRRGRGFYFNSGTWARLIQISPKLRQDAAGFAEAFKRMKASTMEALDGAPEEQSLTLRRCSVVSIWRESGATIGELRRVAAQPGPTPSLAMEPVPGTRHSIT
jgi:hypothetical protein